jgi:Flp pilus assembly secretin CpaC
LLACILLAPLSARGIAEEATEAAAPARPAEVIITKEKTIEAVAGEKQRIIMDSPILDFGVTRPEVADCFIAKPDELLLRTHSPGTGKVIVHLQGGERIALRIRVHVADVARFAEELKKKLGHIQGLNIEVVGEKILVDGRVLYLEDMDAVERVVGDNPSIINLTSLSSRNARILSREIQHELRESGIYGVNVEVIDNTVTLVGTLGSETLVKKAERIAATYTPTFDSRLEVTAERPEADKP